MFIHIFLLIYPSLHPHICISAHQWRLLMYTMSRKKDRQCFANKTNIWIICFVGLAWTVKHFTAVFFDSLLLFHRWSVTTYPVTFHALKETDKISCLVNSCAIHIRQFVGWHIRLTYWPYITAWQKYCVKKICWWEFDVVITKFYACHVYTNWVNRLSADKNSCWADFRPVCWLTQNTSMDKSDRQSFVSAYSETVGWQSAYMNRPIEELQADRSAERLLFGLAHLSVWFVELPLHTCTSMYV